MLTRYELSTEKGMSLRRWQGSWAIIQKSFKGVAELSQQGTAPAIARTDVQFSESFEVDGREMFKHACGIGLEGVVSKVRDSRYVSGRCNDWVKKTCAQRETLPIAGFAMKQNKFDGVYVGRRKGNDLIYAGKVDHGFDTAARGYPGPRSP
jgi:ATP-dependent DNA ligase